MATVHITAVPGDLITINGTQAYPTTPIPPDPTPPDPVDPSYPVLGDINQPPGSPNQISCRGNNWAVRVHITSSRATQWGFSGIAETTQNAIVSALIKDAFGNQVANLGQDAGPPFLTLPQIGMTYSFPPGVYYLELNAGQFNAANFYVQ